MINYGITYAKPQFINGVGTRIDCQLTNEDSRDGIFIEIEVESTIVGAIVCDIYNTITKPTNAELASFKTSDHLYNVNTGAVGKEYIRSVNLDFSAYTKNVIFIKGGENFGGGTAMPDELKPLLVLRVVDTGVKITNVNITKKGVL